ncbi:hypothetical protein CYY_010051 [Polysphondylium violaceum]|uniref:BRCT domain-containing protein n=1 Tax=Polysphondylium violaceum TaxID=133409 RepID=A0A8J4V2C5_9MYCE|nr:hypothetical protein CYY_010051 [Polysphondylium violaceum]
MADEADKKKASKKTETEKEEKKPKTRATRNNKSSDEDETIVEKKKERKDKKDKEDTDDDKEQEEEEQEEEVTDKKGKKKETAKKQVSKEKKEVKEKKETKEKKAPATKKKTTATTTEKETKEKKGTKRKTGDEKKTKNSKKDDEEEDEEEEEQEEDDDQNDTPKKKGKNIVSDTEDSEEDDVDKTKYIAVTGFADPEAIYGEIKGLNDAMISEEHDEITHIVLGENASRTLKVLYGIAHGNWIVDKKWINKSAAVGHFVDEEEYETTLFKGAAKSRAAVDDGEAPLFYNMAFYLHGKKADKGLNKTEKTKLISLLGGKISKNISTANVCIVSGDHDPIPKYNGTETVDIVNDKWLLDSIQEYKILPFSDYSIN